MSYRITYTSKWTGEKTEHVYQGSVSGAEGWAQALSRDNNECRAEAVHVADGPYDHSGKVTHVVTVGHDR